jgi:hypothetical protein
MSMTDESDLAVQAESALGGEVSPSPIITESADRSTERYLGRSRVVAVSEKMAEVIASVFPICRTTGTLFGNDCLFLSP